MFWCKSNQISEPIAINSIVESKINYSKTAIKNKLEKYLYNREDYLNSNFESFEDISFYIYEADTLVFWQGEIIANDIEGDWQVNQESNQILYSFVIDQVKINAKISSGLAISSNSSESLISLEQIQSIEKPKSKRQLLGFSVLFLILSFIVCWYNFKTTSQALYLKLISYFVLTGICLFAAFNESLVQLPNNLSSLMWLLSGIFFLFSSLSFPEIKKLGRHEPLFYSTLTGAFIAGFNVLTQNYLTKHQELDFQKIDFQSFNQFLFSIGGILILFGIWIIFRHAFKTQNESLPNKIYKCVVLISSYLIFSYLGMIELPYPLVVLFLIVYYLTADLFFEVKDQNATWLIWWIILNASFFSSNLYFISIQKEIDNSLHALKSFYKEVNPEELDHQKGIIDSINATQFFEEIKSLPGNAKLSSADIKSYLSELAISDMSASEIFYFHKDGSSGLLGRDINIDQFKTYISIYDKVLEGISYDHLSGRYLKQFEQLKDFYIISESKNNDPDFDFTVFQDGSHIYGNIDEIPEYILEYLGTELVYTRNAQTHIAYRPKGNLVLYSKKKYDSFLKPISIFSLIFCLAILSLFIFTLFNNRFGNKSNLPIFFYHNNTLRLRIQIIIIFLVLLSFVSIALITSLYFKNILRNSSEKEITSKVMALNNSFQNSLRKVYDQQSAYNIIENDIPKLSKIHDVNINFYNTNGRGNFDQDLVYPFYPYQTFKTLNDLSPITNVNKNNEVLAYFPLTTINQGTLGYLKIGNTLDQGRSSDPLSDFLGTILNLYVFLFLIAGAIAIAVSRSITRPLSTLSQKFNSIKVGKKNEIINWDSNDEIGQLISNYNDMVQKLDLNIELMAKTERDSAWQEMAKQVAHEIKNPLTPMKLSLQYLQSSIDRNPDKAQELIKRTSHTLLEQIDNLTEIANAFSNLASLPQADNNRIVLNEVVEAVHDLFRKRDDMEIQLSEPLEEIVVFADKGHLVRILNNIVKNAIQSIPQDRTGKIDIKLYTNQNNAIISVKDNGEGIPQNLRSKIFTPKFTTKNSGSGLGLAIAKNMIESFNGRIYFNTEINKGTTFFIEIPLMRNPIIKSGVERVEL